MLEFIKTIVNALKMYIDEKASGLNQLVNDKLISSRPDWNQNDESAENYIENRPFYEEEINTSVLKKNTFAIENTNIFYNVGIANDVLEVGRQYVVIFDNERYLSTIVKENSEMGNQCYIYDNDDHILTIDSNPDRTISVVTNNTSLIGEHTIEIFTYDVVAHKINKKYLPETYATETRLQEVQTLSESISFDLQTEKSVRETADELKMDKNNPTGTGSFNIDGTGWFKDGLQVGGNAQGDGAKNVLLEGDAVKLEKIKYSLSMSSVGFYFCYGNGKFVAVSSTENSKEAAYSEDGINWVLTNIPINTRCTSVIHGNNKFVAISNSKEAAYSEDGINWISTILPVSDNWSDVTYGNGKFVAISSTNNTNFAYSEDGINWILTNSQLTNALETITYGNGKFVAITSLGSYYWFSTDGINWSREELIGGNWSDITYGDGKFIVVGTTIKYMEDNTTTWTSATVPSDFSTRRNIIYINGKYMAYSTMSNNVIYSNDGITWTSENLSIPISIYNVIYGNNKFIANTGSNTIAYSEDGIIWINCYENLSQNNEDITKKIRELILCNNEYEPKLHFTLSDTVTGHNYIVEMNNGQLISYCTDITELAVTTLPTKTEYVVGESLDTTGMIVTATCADGSMREVTGWTIPTVPTITEGLTSVEFTVSYTENGKEYTTSATLPITVTASTEETTE